MTVCKPAAAMPNVFSASCMTARMASQNGSAPLVSRMIRLGLELPPQPAVRTRRQQAATIVESRLLYIDRELSKEQSQRAGRINGHRARGGPRLCRALDQRYFESVVFGCAPVWAGASGVFLPPEG